MQDGAEGEIEPIDVRGRQRLPGYHFTELIVVVVERLRRGAVDGVHHVEEGILDLLDLGLG